MTNQPDGSSVKLGRLKQAFRPPVGWLWFLPTLAIPPLILLGLAILLTADELAEGGRSFGDVSNYLSCAGLVGLLIAVLAAIWVSDFRAWRATKHMQLGVFENGFSWTDGSKAEEFTWADVEKIRYRKIYVSTKAFKRWVRVIKTIHLRGGREIKLPETLDLERITKLIEHARGNV
jgi:hypothetical protein